VDTRPCFIYAITHLASGRRYVGSCLTPTRRWIEHRSDLKCQRHHCSYLQRAWNKYGPDAFMFSILKELPANNAKERALAELKAISECECFNSRVANLGATNFANSEETRRKINRGIAKRLANDPELQQWLSNRGAALAAHARTPERRAIRAKLTKEMWKDSAHRKRVSDKLAIHWSRPGAREEHSKRVKLHRSTAEAKKKNSEITKRLWSDPNGGLRNRSNGRWRDPEAKLIQSQKLKAAWIIRRQKMRISGD